MADFGALYQSELDLQLNNSDSNTLFTTARRKAAINDAAREFAVLTECYVRRATISVSCNTAEYVLSTISDYARIAKDGLVEYHRTDSNGALTQLAGEDFPRRDELWRNRYEPGWRTSTTPVEHPQGYYLRPDGGRQLLGLSEPPDVGSSETASLIVPYVARPEPMTDSTHVPFTDASGNTRFDLVEYHQALPHYAAHKLLPLIGDAQGAQQQLQAFMGYVARYNQNTRPKGGTHVTVARSYYRESRRGGFSDAALDRDPRWRWR